MTGVRRAVMTVAAVAACGGSVSAPDRPAATDAAGFSASVEGLRGRLVSSGAAGGPIEVQVELENVSDRPLRLTTGDPFAVTAQLADAGGRAIDPTGSRLDVLSTSQVLELAPGARATHPLTARHDDVAATLDLTTAFWTLAPGSYRLTVGWSSHADGGWSGQLALPPIDLVAR